MNPTSRPASQSVLRSALSLMSVRLVLMQIGLALLAFLLYAAWLRIPDASVFEVIGSLVLAAIAIGVPAAGEIALMLRLASLERTVRRLLRGTLLLLAGVALWFAWCALLEHLSGNYRANDYLWAGYLNSRFPHQWRNFFSYPHILLWLGWMWSALEWLGAGGIAIFVFAGAASEKPVRAIGSGLRCLTYWAALVLGAIAAAVLTDSLLQWTPGRGLRIEMLSLVLRLTLAALIDAAVVCFLLAILAVCVQRSDARYSTPAGTPEESQPRTVEGP